MTLVVDASVALKWVIEEDGSDRAEALLASDELIAPDFLPLECANVLAQHVKRKILAPEQARARLFTIRAARVRLVPSTVHIAEAQRIAVALSQSAYDSLYLAVALAETAVLVTSDKRFEQAARPAHGVSVRLL